MIDPNLEDNLGKGLHLAHLNIRSLTGGHKFDVTKLQISTSGVDIFTLSETWLNDSIPTQLLDIQNYNLIRLDRNWSGLGSSQGPKRGGGLACYIRKGIKFSESKFEGLNISCKNLEMQWVLVSLDNVRPIVVVNIYRPPQGDYKEGCKLISEAFGIANLKQNTDIFVLGDSNINMLDRKTASTKELDFTMKALGLTQVVKEPTRTAFKNGTSSSTLLDLIFTNSPYIKATSTLDMNLSDHLAVLVTRKKVMVKREKINFAGRSYRNYDKEKFQENLAAEDWSTFFQNFDPDILWELMEDIILRNIEPMCALKQFRMFNAREPWLTNVALEAIRDKDRLLKRAKRSDKREDWESARRVRNAVGREVEGLRAEFLKSQQEENKADPKKFWNTISSIIPGKKDRGSTIWLKDGVNGGELDPELSASFFNKYFTDIGPKLADEHSTTWEYFGEEIGQNIEAFTTGTEEVYTLCKEINPMKSSGLDKIWAKICKDAFLVLVDQLVHLFNCSLLTSIFPKAWKIAKISPLFKGGDREDVGNYRPVSLLPLPGKLLEKIVHNNFYKFFEKNTFLTVNQGGFRKGFSTISTIADLTDDLFTSINNNSLLLGAFVDLKKAFDTVNYEILLKKLVKAGIRGAMYEWCKNYISDRHQATRVNGITTELLPVTCGVPQGSVLGPLFFLVYINDLRYALDNCGMRLYADDTVIYHTGNTIEENQKSLQASLKMFEHWCNVNALTINTKKTKIMMFGRKHKIKKTRKPSIKIYGKNIQCVPSFKYLGVILDSSLTLKTHIASVIHSILHKIGVLSKLRRYLNTRVAVQRYKSMVLPYFDYANILYNKANSSDLDKLQRMQNRCLRLCLGQDRYFSTDQAHKTAMVPFLADRRSAHLLKFHVHS